MAECTDHPLWKDAETMPFQLVLEGGAMRNLFTCGVVDFLMDRRVFAESVIGTSAGAICGYNYASGAAGRMAYCNLNFRTDWRFMSVRSMLLTGDYVGNRFLFNTIPNKIEHLHLEWFTESPIDFTSVATDLSTGEAEYYRYPVAGRKEAGEEETLRGMKHLAAGATVPFVNRPVKVDGERLMDGGVADGIPFEHDHERYQGRQIVVLTRPRSFVATPAKGMPLARRQYMRYPRFVEKMELRPEVYNRKYRELEQMHDNGEVYAIWPDPPLDIKMAEKDLNKLFAAYEQGVRQAAEQWPAIKRYLGMKEARTGF